MSWEAVPAVILFWALIITVAGLLLIVFPYLSMGSQIRDLMKLKKDIKRLKRELRKQKLI